MRALSKSAEDVKALSESSPRAAGKARAIVTDDPLGVIYRGTAAKYFPSGEEYFESLISDIKRAEKYIFLEYFIIEEGELWDEIHSVLVKKAGEGVEIRLLFDDVGCMKTLPRTFDAALFAEGISARRFARVSARLSSVHHNRDHRKIAIIDGKIGYTGGVNIADEYVNKKMRFGHWKDGGIRLSGDAVIGLLRLFLMAWDLTVGRVSDYEGLLAPCGGKSDGGYYLPFGSGPAPIYKRPVAKNLILNIVNQAERFVYITTPYLIIDYDLTEALCNAAKRGVDVKIVTPAIPDKRLVWIMTRSSYSYLIRGGVGIYEYDGFIHEKLIVSDGEYAIIGTVNLDYRSLAHHFECGVWSYLSPLCDTAHAEFLKTLEKSKRITEADARPTLAQRLFKIFIRIFAPLM
jgi:cardiolipin synthase